MTKYLDQSPAMDMAETLADLEDPETSIEALKGLESFIYELRNCGQQVSLRLARQQRFIVPLLKYVRGNKARPESYEPGFALMPGSAIVLSDAVYISEPVDSLDSDSRLFVGDSQYSMPVAYAAEALSVGGGLKLYTDREAAQIRKQTAEQLGHLIGIRTS